MDIHQAAKAVVKQIDETGELPSLLRQVGLCWLLLEAGCDTAYRDMAALEGKTEELDLLMGSSYISVGGYWSEERMTLLALLAETSAEDFEESATL